RNTTVFPIYGCKTRNPMCHHKTPKSLGGTDEYKNLVWLTTQAYEIIHSTDLGTIAKYLNKMSLDKKGLNRVNSLRKLVGNSVI
ncbi:MAG: HNH endonuclease, partial [Bacilli bacterium]